MQLLHLVLSNTVATSLILDLSFLYVELYILKAKTDVILFKSKPVGIKGKGIGVICYHSCLFSLLTALVYG